MAQRHIAEKGYGASKVGRRIAHAYEAPNRALRGTGWGDAPTSTSRCRVELNAGMVRKSRAVVVAYAPRVAMLTDELDQTVFSVNRRIEYRGFCGGN